MVSRWKNPVPEQVGGPRAGGWPQSRWVAPEQMGGPRADGWPQSRWVAPEQVGGPRAGEWLWCQQGYAAKNRFFIGRNVDPIMTNIPMEGWPPEGD